jgi:GGDEF domain-containing protein
MPVSSSLVERLAAIIDPSSCRHGGEEFASLPGKVAVRRADALARASRCLAEVMADTGGGSHSHLHVHVKGPVRLVRSGETMHLETIRPGALEAAEREEQD